MKTAEDLRQLLTRIDRKGYPAYKDTKGIYRFQGFVLGIDHVQGDPFAAPSRLHVEVGGKTAGFPERLYDKEHKRIALQDELIRQFARASGKYSFQAKGSGKSGLLSVTRCGQEVLERSACTIDEKSGDVVLRFEVGFPANGRTINARELSKILFEFLPQCVQKSCLYRNLDERKTEQIMELAEDQAYIRRELAKRGLIAFVADGAVLPRESGISQRPMKGAVPFQSPETMRVEMDLPYHGKITGMGIKKGITLIVGGGYHGKSTLLKALELCVYPHIAGDGREYVVTDPDAVKIRAEDGRSIKHTDISMFINDLPNKKDTHAFYTEDASGSTSQAANVVEAMEAGASAFLIDEDTSATNFMVRDELMRQVIHRDMEPITPFIERAGALYERQGISTILVAGSSGAYFQIADQIVQMDRYVPKDITEKAKKAAESYPALHFPETPVKLPGFQRRPKSNPGIYHKGRIKLKTMGRDGISVGNEHIDLRYVEQLADSEQLTCLGYMVKFAEEKLLDGKRTVREIVEEIYRLIEEQGLEVLTGKDLPGNLGLPRKEELYACIDRYRGLRL